MLNLNHMIEKNLVRYHFCTADIPLRLKKFMLQYFGKLSYLIFETKIMVPPGVWLFLPGSVHLFFS